MPKYPTSPSENGAPTRHDPDREPFAFGGIHDGIVPQEDMGNNDNSGYSSSDKDNAEIKGEEQISEEGQCIPQSSKKAAYVSPQERIARMDEERAIRIGQRREATNIFSKAFSKVVPYGGIVSSGFNLASSAIAAGIISLPSAFNTSGLVMSIIYLIIIGFLTVYSYTLLGIAGKKTGIRNYEVITRILLGRFAGYLLAVLMFLLSFGAEISYVLSLGTILKAYIRNSDSVYDYFRTDSGVRVLTVIVWFLAMLPLTLPKEINSLRYFSVVGVCFIVYFIICMIAHCARTVSKQGVAKDIIYFRTGNEAINGLAIFMFSFISQINCYEVYDEMYKPGVRRITKAATLSVFLSGMLYFCSGLFGYLEFGGLVVDSVLMYYDPISDIWMGIAYAGIMLKVCVGYGMHMIPVRDAIYYFANVDVKDVPWWKNALVCSFMAGLSLVAGLFIPSINTVFGMVGGLCGGFIGFIFPALLFMYSGNWSLKSVGFYHYLMTYFLMIVGVIGVVFGTISTIYSVA